MTERIVLSFVLPAAAMGPPPKPDAALPPEDEWPLAGAFSPSFFTTRPPGPEPLKPESCTPFSTATFLASGEALIRPPSGVDVAGAAVATAVGGSAGVPLSSFFLAARGAGACAS